ncbi:MAG: hypothetical protein JW901_06635, partial [Dehalococcoidia bacterium]|nr:hypothetical protein [Dehalococcoidia bacterium]
MNINTILVAILLPALMIITISTACQPATLPAKFEVTSLEISPEEINMGETANVSVKVMNTGGTSSIYGVNLYVDDKKVSTKLITLDPGYTQSVNFPLSVDKAGTHEIAVGEKNGTLTVISQLVQKQMEIAYDTGVAKDHLSMVKPSTGYVVRFVSPSTQFSISRISVFGLIYGSPGFHIVNSDLQIWDTDQKVLYSTPFSGDQFSLRTRLGANIDSTGAWADMEIPDVKVNGDFYVNIYTG